MWNTIVSAPKGKNKTVACFGGKHTKESFVPDWILVWRHDDDMPRLSHYLPKADRWLAYSKEHPPTHWHPLPELPDVR
jgi:Protein of unknown function (DUF551)